MRFKQGKNQSGFTLVELLVSISIIALISGVFLANLHYAGQVGRVNMTAQKMISDIRWTQSYALGLKEFDGIVPPAFPIGGWGIYFDQTAPDNNNYVIFADHGNGSGGIPDHLYNAGGAFDETYQIVNFDNLIIGDIRIEGSSENEAHITFEPPNPTIRLCDGTGDCSFAYSRITLDSNGRTKTVLINIFGLTDINETNVELNSATGQKCQEKCQENGYTNCVSIGTDTGGTNGKYWKAPGGSCTLLNGNCNNTMNDEVQDCADRAAEWTYCQCAY